MISENASAILEREGSRTGERTAATDRKTSLESAIRDYGVSV